jgi:hypothetical protein
MDKKGSSRRSCRLEKAVWEPDVRGTALPYSAGAAAGKRLRSTPWARMAISDVATRAGTRTDAA